MKQALGGLLPVELAYFASAAEGEAEGSGRALD